MTANLAHGASKQKETKAKNNIRRKCKP